MPLFRQPLCAARPAAALREVAVLHDQRHVATRDTDGNLALWDVTTACALLRAFHDTRLTLAFWCCVVNERPLASVRLHLTCHVGHAAGLWSGTGARGSWRMSCATPLNQWLSPHGSQQTSAQVQLPDASTGCARGADRKLMMLQKPNLYTAALQTSFKHCCCRPAIDALQESSASLWIPPSGRHSLLR